MSERDEMRKLIDVIERGAMSASVEQNVEDLKRECPIFCV